MIRIAITQAAYDAICATLPVGSVAVEAEANERGERYVWLEEGSVNRLGAMRGPSESFSDVILRIAGRGEKRPRDTNQLAPPPRPRRSPVGGGVRLRRDRRRRRQRRVAQGGATVIRIAITKAQKAMGHALLFPEPPTGKERQIKGKVSFKWLSNLHPS